MLKHGLINGPIQLFLSMLVVLYFFSMDLPALAPMSYQKKTVTQNCSEMKHFDPWNPKYLWIDSLITEKGIPRPGTNVSEGMLIPAGIVGLDDFLSQTSFTVDLEYVYQMIVALYPEYQKELGWPALEERGIQDVGDIVVPVISGFIRFIEKTAQGRQMREILGQYSYSYNPDTHEFTFHYPPQTITVEDFGTDFSSADEGETLILPVDGTQRVSLPPSPIEGRLAISGSIIRDIMRILENPIPQLNDTIRHNLIQGVLQPTPFSYVRMIQTGGQKDILVFKKKSSLDRQHLPRKFQQTDFFVVHVAKPFIQQDTTALENLTALKLDPHIHIVRLPEDRSLEPRFRNICITLFLGMPLDDVVKQVYTDTVPNPYHLSYLLLECLIRLRPAHARGIVHRDLKPGNILMNNNGKVSLIDHGVSSDVLRFIGKIDSYIFSPSHAPTECYMPGLSEHPRAVYLKNFSTKVDVFSLGLIIYEFLTGEDVFGDFSYAHVMEFVMGHSERVTRLHAGCIEKMAKATRGVRFKWVVKNADQLYSVIQKMLSPEQGDRPETEDAIRDLLAMTEIPGLAREYIAAQTSDSGKYMALGPDLKTQLENEMIDVFASSVPWFHLIAKKGMVFQDALGDVLDYNKTMAEVLKRWTGEKTPDQILKEKIDSFYSVQRGRYREAIGFHRGMTDDDA
ncbi:MAG: protein kinase [Candidatus Aureabacteria bacterium]|nr:protein kinase [Candidatus Auribacterota bacterium]